MTTSVNDERRQDARSGEMTLDLRSLVKALADMYMPRFLYAGRHVKLMLDAQIPAEPTLMSGMGEGNIFTSPTRSLFIEAGLAYVL